MNEVIRPGRGGARPGAGRPPIRRPEPSSADFPRAAFYVAQSRALKRPLPDLIARDEAACSILTRASILPGDTTTSGWASQVAAASLRAFLADLQPNAAASRLVADAVPANVPAGVASLSFPVRSGPSALSTVAELDPIPVGNETFTTVDVAPVKLGSVVPFSRELALRADSEAVFRQMLAADLAAGLDTLLFDTTNGLLASVTPLVGFAGGDATAIKTDLSALGSAVASGGSGRVLYFAAPETLARLRVADPDLAGNLDFAVSSSLASTTVVAADPGAILISVDQDPAIEVSGVGVVHMSTIPAAISDGGVADPTRGLWQTASLAIRILFDFGFAKSRATAVAFVTGATW